jgi:hypothetical protein
MLQRPLETVLRRIEQEGGLPLPAPAAHGPSELTS